MPNIFPRIDLSQPTVGAQVTPDDAVPTPSVLGSVNAPSSSSLALNGVDNDVQAARDRVAADAPHKYDYSAHGVLGNIGHVIARTGNIVGDVLDPQATALIPNSDLYNARMRQTHMDELDKAQEKQAAAQKESDTTENESANREQKGDIASATQDTAMAKTNAQLAQHGFKMDPEKGIVPLAYEEMSPTQQAVYDLKGSQSAQADATAELRAAEAANAPEKIELAKQKLASISQTQDIARQRLGLSAQGLGFQQEKFYNPQPTAMERNKADMGHSSIHQIGEMRDVLDKRPDIFGPGAGRANRVQQWMGSSDPDAIKYRNSAQYLADHSAALFGGRGEYIMKQLHDLTDERFGPEALKQALDEAEGTTKGFVNAGATHGKGGKSGYDMPAGGAPASGGKPEYAFVNGKLVKQ